MGDTAADDIRSERLDLAIVSRITPWPEGTSDGIKEWVLGTDPLCLYVAADHRLASATAPVSISDLREEPWILSHNTRLGRLTSALCNAAGFEPVVAALVDDVSIAVRLAGVGWGATIAPELTTAVTELPVARIPIDGLETERESVLIIRAGEDTVPRLAVAIAATRKAAKASTQLPRSVPTGAG